LAKRKLPPFGLWPDGGGVCPKLRLKGRRGCSKTVNQHPATMPRQGMVAFYSE
jgi:hypothetical protein